MRMSITINRKPKNVRVGSRAWAASLPADKWAWKLSRRGNSTDRVDIYNGDMLVVSIDAWTLNHTSATPNYALPDSIDYGGEIIGSALLGDFYAWAKTLDLDVDDAGKLTISRV